ncbi:MAG: DUF2085 domain-containing protein [Opitutaceae bacterium]|nr:DUF2085 domain-containing protein [Opitutaceae bacterium]
MLEQLFSFVCGQNPSHTWAPGGELLPCCERCTGLYAGAAIALLLQFVLRMRPTARFLQLHGLLLMMMIPLGFHWVAHGALVRTGSGLFFGFGVVSLLWLLPGGHLPARIIHTVAEAVRLSRPSFGETRQRAGKRLPAFGGLTRSATTARSTGHSGCEISGPAVRPQTRPQQLLYAAGLAASFVVVPALAMWGGRIAALALTMAVLVGLIGLGVLVVANVGVGMAWFISRRTRSALHPAR